jgi:hypothetical protein
MESFLSNRPSLAATARPPSPRATDDDFQPFLPASSVREKAAVVASDGASEQASDDAEPQIEVVNHNGCVDRIVIVCGCCKRIELACEY